jgi:hypothetical protein
LLAYLVVKDNSKLIQNIRQINEIDNSIVNFIENYSSVASDQKITQKDLQDKLEMISLIK